MSTKVKTGDGGDTSPVDSSDTPPIHVLDPCASIEEKESQLAVRQLLTKAGYKVQNETADIGCCGFGGHIVTSTPDLQKRFAQRRVSEKDGILVSYCANCRDVFANEGADARHILGLLFGIDDDHRRPPDLDERRENRRRLKKHFTKESFVMNQSDTPEILIERTILDKMNREMILKEQVLNTILQAETDRSMILDEGDNLYYAHKRFTTTTVWVVYCKNGSSIQVTNVYVHRVDIREDD